MEKIISEGQIEQWKEKYGAVCVIDYEDKKVYLRPFDSSFENYYATACRVGKMQAKDDMVEAGTILFNSCYLGGLGDLTEINENTPEFVALSVACNNLFQVPEIGLTII